MPLETYGTTSASFLFDVWGKKLIYIYIQLSDISYCSFLKKIIKLCSFEIIKEYSFLRCFMVSTKILSTTVFERNLSIESA